MNKLQKLERDRTNADLATVQAMLARLTDQDVMQRFSLEGRRDELAQQLAMLQPIEDVTASAALFFGGRPVVGKTGIESEFGGQAIQLFQDLISKQYAQDGGRLGERGVVPDKAASRMHITSIVRGSFGFLLEELDTAPGLLDSSLKSTVDNVSQLVAAFGDNDEERFEAAAGNVEQRVMESAKAFFKLLKEQGATFRFLIGETDRSFDTPSVERALERAENTSINEDEERIVGVLGGILPDSHMFEFRTDTPRGLIKGRVDKKIPAAQLSEMLRQWQDQQSIGQFTIRTVLKSGRVTRESLTLTAIDAAGT